MKEIKEALKLTSISEIEIEIEERIDLVNQMVGNLYPHVIADENKQLRERIADLKYNKNVHKNFPDEDIDFNRQFTEKDNVWNDCTDNFASNKRKQGFKCFTNMYRGMMLHYFPCYEYNNEQYYHVIEEYVISFPHTSWYFLMTKKQIEEKYKINI